MALHPCAQQCQQRLHWNHARFGRIRWGRRVAQPAQSLRDHLPRVDAIQEAVKECKEFRAREGKIVEDKFREYIASIKSGLDQVTEQDLVRMPGIRERMKKSLLEWNE